MTKAEFLNNEFLELQASIANNPAGLRASEVSARYYAILKVIKYINEHPQESEVISIDNIADFKNSDAFQQILRSEMWEDNINEAVESLSLPEIITFQSISLLSIVNLKFWEVNFETHSRADDIFLATKFTHGIIASLIKKTNHKLLSFGEHARTVAYEGYWIEQINNRSDLTQQQKEAQIQHFHEEIAALQIDPSFTLVKDALTINSNLRRKMLFQAIANNKINSSVTQIASRLNGKNAANIGVEGRESLFVLPENTTLNHMWQILNDDLVISLATSVSQSYVLQEAIAADPEFKKLIKKDIGLLAFHVMEKCDLTKNTHVIFDSTIKDPKSKQTNQIIARNIQKIWIEKKIETITSSDCRKATSFIADFDKKYNRLNELTAKRTAQNNITARELRELNRLTSYFESSTNKTKYIAARKYLIDVSIKQIEIATELLIRAPSISELHKDDLFFKETRINSQLRGIYDNKMEKLLSFSSYCRDAAATNFQGSVEQIRTALSQEVEPICDAYSSFNTIAEQNSNDRETVRQTELQHQQQQEERRIREIQENPELLIRQNYSLDRSAFLWARIEIVQELLKDRGYSKNSILHAIGSIDFAITREREQNEIAAANPPVAAPEPQTNDASAANDESANPEVAPQANDESVVINDAPANLQSSPQPRARLERDILKDLILENKDLIWAEARSRLYEKQMQRVKKESQEFGIDPDRLIEVYCHDLNPRTRCMDFYIR